MNPIAWSLRNRQVTLAVLALAFAFGIYALAFMPRREDPRMRVPDALVVAYYPGATAAQVEEQVTRKIECYLFQFAEVRKAKTFSTSRDGVAVIDVVLNDDVKDLDGFWSKLSHEMLKAKHLDMPPEVLGPIVNSEFGETEALLIALEGKDADPRRLRNYCRLLEAGLRTIPATSKVKRLGEQKERITVYFDSDKLSQYGISLRQIADVLKSQNAVSAAGEAETENGRIILSAQGRYASQNQIENQIIGTTPSGAVTRLRDVATVAREYADTENDIEVHGRQALLLAVQMNGRENIVAYGKDVDRKIAEISELLPSDVRITTLVNQPALVHANISHFLLEFLLAIVSVIIVIILMLPLRIAAVAAAAIPMTLALTFAILHACGIELHQVTLAALIIVLGLVVDDAIVVADNYVALLDQGVDRPTAAWRSASDLKIPIFTATLAIIASFLPMVMISGVVGDFIRKGIGRPSPDAAPAASRRSLLGAMQSGYDRAIRRCDRRRVLTVVGSVLTVAAAVLVFERSVTQRFFPYAERNQFMVEIWMPEGTKLEATHRAAVRIGDVLKSDPRVASYAVFNGAGAPRVYYNFAPEFPASNYAQILINARDNGTAESLARELGRKVEALVPEGTAQVKRMQQGLPLAAPVEVRIFGEDVGALQRLGREVRDILQRAEGSRLVQDDFREDQFGIGIDLKDEAARLGFTTESIGRALYANTHGAAVSTLYEGDNAIDIVLRRDARRRATAQSLENIYVESPVTGKSVPLRQVAGLTPQWQPGRIMHRNGTRCLTVRSETRDGMTSADLLAGIKPEIAKLALPAGYRIEYGGEHANKSEVFSQMLFALAIGLLLIFLILLAQFRSLKEAAIIMATIPMSGFGAVAGLAITRNDFGFTAFIGLISLSGIVVRNAIILIEYADESVAQGMDIRAAAIEAGKRRLRPIFLTATAASVGVTPMILSGSSLWSPLATVIAFGVMWNMVMALCALPTASRPFAQPAEIRLGLREVTLLALRNNHLLNAKSLAVQEQSQKCREVKVQYLPKLEGTATYQLSRYRPEFTVPQGSFGQLPMGGALVSLPTTDKTFALGERRTLEAGVLAYQPVTQIPKIHAGARMAETEYESARIERDQAYRQVRQAVEKLYCGCMIAAARKRQGELQLAAAEAKLHDGESALRSGKGLPSDPIGLKAAVAGERQIVMEITNQIEDLSDDLKRLAGLSSSTAVSLEPIAEADTGPTGIPADSVLRKALSGNADLRNAELARAKAGFAYLAGAYGYLPDIGVVGGYNFQKGAQAYPEHNVFAGLALKWNITDLLSNTFVENQRADLKLQANENLAHTREQVKTDVAKALRKVSQAEEMLAAANDMVEYRREDLQTRAARNAAGLETDDDLLTSRAALAKAEADRLAARLGYRMALTELRVLTGSDEP